MISNAINVLSKLKYVEVVLTLKFGRDIGGETSSQMKFSLAIETTILLAIADAKADITQHVKKDLKDLYAISATFEKVISDKVPKPISIAKPALLRYGVCTL